jgi:hypothetical protein
MTDTLTPLAVDADPTPSPGSNRRAIIAVGAAGALLLLSGGYYLLMGGSSSEPHAFVPQVQHAPAVVKTVAENAKPTSKNAVKPAAQLPALSVAPLGRDPFKPLYIQPVAAPVQAVATVPAAPTGTAMTPTSTSTTPTSTSTTPANPVATTYALSLSSVYGSGSNLTGSFKVGSAQQQAKPGSVFGKTSELRLLSLQQESSGLWTAVVQVGDDQPFNLSQREVKYVR